MIFTYLIRFENKNKSIHFLFLNFPLHHVDDLEEPEKVQHIQRAVGDS